MTTNLSQVATYLILYTSPPCSLSGVVTTETIVEIENVFHPRMFWAGEPALLMVVLAVVRPTYVATMPHRHLMYLAISAKDACERERAGIFKQVRRGDETTV